MKKIIPHFWFDTEAKEAAEFYTSIFNDSSVVRTTLIKNTPSGDCDFVEFKLAGMDFMAISAGPLFKINPSISFFVTFDNEPEIESVWKKLSDGGEVLMEYGTYPWAEKYGWLKDKYGITWQLSMGANHQFAQKITPSLMFTKEMAGKAQEAIDLYVSMFPNSKVEMIAKYEKGEGDDENFIKHSRFTLNGQSFIAMDSSGPHEFVFNEAVSLLVNCDTQEEIDTLTDKLSADPESEQCGWVKDRFGVSWQLNPSMMEGVFASKDEEKIAKVMKVVLKMKRLNITEIEAAMNS